MIITLSAKPPKKADGEIRIMIILTILQSLEGWRNAEICRTGNKAAEECSRDSVAIHVEGQ